MFSRARVPLILIALGLALSIAGPIGRLSVVGGLVLFAPGYLLWSLADADLRLPRFVAPALWLGLSLSLIPILFLWSSTLGLRLTAPILTMQAIGVALLAAWRWLRARQRPLPPRWLVAGWSLVVGLVGLTRALEIRGIVAPLWVDSLHHTLLVRIVSESGRIPTSLEPYLPIDQIRYHWGYHTIVAAWTEIAYLPLLQGVLWSGQILNALIAVVAYGLGAFMLRSPRAGLIAAVVAGLLSLMPAYYVTWGRYTQLTGLLVLPGLLIGSIALAEQPRWSWRLIVPTALLLSGLMLIHYRVLVFYGAFMVPYGLLLALRRPGSVGSLALRFALVGGLAALIVAPWVLEMLRRVLIPYAVAPSGLTGSGDYNGIDWALLNYGNNRVLYGLAGLGTLLALLAWRLRVIATAAWIGILFLLANPAIVGLPSSWFINNHSVIIMLFLPVSVLVAYGVNQLAWWLLRVMPGARRLWTRYALAAGFVGIAVFGTWQLRSVVNQATVLVRPADIDALAWAAENTPQDARFLVNSAFWLNGAYRGTDGGWWLLPIAGRWVTAPPALYVYGKPEYRQAVEALNRRISEVKIDQPEQLKQLVRDERISHVYVGGNQSGPIKADMLFGDPMFTPIYDANGVTIFAVRATS
ncbi:MAG TPA: hypothetical protein VFZ66_05230 [Herpetosiphonaceae bacterium]